jgi:hypothetical protein
MKYSLLVALLFLTFYAHAQLPQADNRVPGVLLIEAQADQKELAGCLQEIKDQYPSMQLHALAPRFHAWKLEFPEGAIDLEWAFNMTLTCDLVQSVSFDYYLEPRDQTPDDSFYENQWNLEIIQAPAVWDITTGGSTLQNDTIVIAVLDSGFDLEHEDLADAVWTNSLEAQGTPGEDDDNNGYVDDLHGWNFIDDTPIHPQDPHGSAVAGILGAQGNNGKGITGVNWNVQWIPMTASTVSQIVEAYNYLLELRQRYNQTQGAEGAFLVASNASIGLDKVFCSDVPIWAAVYDPLGEAGVLSVGATANGEWDVDLEGDVPTTCTSEYLIGVTNTTREDQKFDSAAFGSTSIDLGAPGGPADQGVFTTDWFGGYEESFGGTSAAAPHVAGAIGLLYSLPSADLAELAHQDPAQAARLVRDAILGGTDPLPSLEGISVTGGRLNVYQSMWYLHGVFQDIQPADSPLEYTERRGIIRILPNPVQAGESFQVYFGTRELDPIHFRLFNSVGQLVYELEVASNLFEDQVVELPTENLTQGVYFLMMENGRSPITQRIMVLR